ncbi:peptidoglycan DD-metalloendopeptidase family protein [Legionella sp. W05-934-2]|uniref:peptidoglycan DD-metalloendopeptidase family protein n=1 Tax=Legionella sp. W05-934-2 TaxID=1198649 RepID=UPI003462A284
MREPKKPSRLMAIMALCVAISLPFIMVNTLHHKHKPIKTNIKLPAQLQLPHSTNSTPVAENNWITITTKDGDTLTSLFIRKKLDTRQIPAILKSSPTAERLNHIKPNQKMQILRVDNTLQKLLMPVTATQSLLVYKEGDGYLSKMVSRQMSKHNHYITATVKGSLFGTAKKLNIPSKLINQMAQLFAWEIDFSREVRDGDQFTIIYSAYYSEDKMVGTGDIIAVTYTSHKKVFQAFLNVDKDGNHDYFDADGRSLKKAFDRYPLRFSHISSGFSNKRFHPVLNYKRPHNGVDLAAPLGKPIHATSDGKIEKIQYYNGYGNMIKIRHTDRQFSTIYAHMLRFAKGLSNGSRVKQGQVIGYVGQSGLATGPHCHYEFHVNNHATNPTTVALPRAPSIPNNQLAEFKTRSSTLLAQLKLFEEANSLDKHGLHKAVV